MEWAQLEDLGRSFMRSQESCRFSSSCVSSEHRSLLALKTATFLNHIQHTQSIYMFSEVYILQ